MNLDFEGMTEQERKDFAGYIQGGRPCRLCKYQESFRCFLLNIKVGYEDTCRFLLITRDTKPI